MVDTEELSPATLFDTTVYRRAGEHFVFPSEIRFKKKKKASLFTCYSLGV